MVVKKQDLFGNLIRHVLYWLYGCYDDTHAQAKDVCQTHCTVDSM